MLFIDKESIVNRTLQEDGRGLFHALALALTDKACLQKKINSKGVDEDDSDEENEDGDGN